MLKKNINIFVTHHENMIGRAIINRLKKFDGSIKIFINENLNLTSQSDVDFFFKKNIIDQVYITGGKSGGILANRKYPAEFIYDNLITQTHIINACFLNHVKKILFVASSCVYPKITSFPTIEEALLTGPLELTSEPYAISKIAGLKLCNSYNKQYEKSHNLDYRAVVPTNLYGPGDKYNVEESHVISSLICRMHEAKINESEEIVLWGTGKAKREFLFIEDFAEAAIFIMNYDKEKYNNIVNHNAQHINVGSGEEISIFDLAYLIADVVDYKGKIEFDNINPDGADRKILDTSRLRSMGWIYKTKIKEGLVKTYKNFLTLC